MAYIPTLDDTEEVYAPAKSGAYSPTLIDTEEVFAPTRSGVVNSVAAPEQRNETSFMDALKQSFSHGARNLRQEKDAQTALVSGIPAGAAKLSNKVGARLLNEKEGKDPISAAIENFIGSKNPEYLPIEQQGEFIGEMAPTLAFPGMGGATLAGKLLPSALNKGLLGAALRGSAGGAATNAFAEPLFNPEEDLKQAISHGAETGAIAGAAIPGISKAIQAIPAIGSRALYSVMATPESQKAIANKLYEPVLEETTRGGALVHPQATKQYIQDQLQKLSSDQDPISQQIKEQLGKQLVNMPDRLTPKAAHKWMRSFRKEAGKAARGNLASENANQWPNAELASHLDNLSDAMTNDLINGIKKSRYVGNKLVYEGNPEAARDYATAQDFYRNRVIPAKAHPVNRTLLGVQGGVATLAPHLLDHEGLGGAALALISPHFLHIPNPALNALQRLTGAAGRREIMRKMLLNPALQQNLSKLIPATLNGGNDNANSSF